MPTTKYLGHEITTYVRAHGQETAHVIVDGQPVCFLNGLAEAKRYLREQKAGEHYGPKPASWHIRLDNGASSQYGRASTALSDAAYFAADGRTFELELVEHCAYPGCDGHGTVGERSRSGRIVERPCPRHVAPIATRLECGATDTPAV